MNWNLAFRACILHSNSFFSHFNVLFCLDIDAIDVYNVRFVCMGHGIALAAVGKKRGFIYYQYRTHVANYAHTNSKLRTTNVILHIMIFKSIYE